MLKRACIDSAPCSPRRPNPTCHSFAQGITWSSNRCMLGVMEESIKERSSEVFHELWYCYFCGTLCKINNPFCVIQLCYTVPSSLHCASVMKFWSYIQCHILNENRAISPLRLSLMMSLAIFRIPSSQAMETPEAFNHLHIQ